MHRQTLIKSWYARYSDDIYNFLIYYTGKRDVEDLVQEVFIRAIKAFDRFEGRSNPKTWLLTIARHVAIDDQRKRRFLQWVPDGVLDSLKSQEKTPAEALEMSEDIKELYLSIYQLKRGYREVLILRELQDLSVSETAQILNWSESKVRVTLHRALTALKKAYHNKEGGLIHESHS